MIFIYPGSNVFAEFDGYRFIKVISARISTIVSADV